QAREQKEESTRLPIVQVLHRALKKQGEQLERMQQLQQQEELYGESLNLRELSVQARAKKGEEEAKLLNADAQLFFTNKFGSLLQEMESSAATVLWNSREYKKMLTALRNLSPKKDENFYVQNFLLDARELMQATQEYIREKSVSPITQNGKIRLDLARRLLDTTQELESSLSGRIEKREQEKEKQYKQRLKLLITDKKKALKSHLQENPGPLSEDKVLCGKFAQLLFYLTAQDEYNTSKQQTVNFNKPASYKEDILIMKAQMPQYLKSKGGGRKELMELLEKNDMLILKDFLRFYSLSRGV
ncbi:MAG: hypothetical protein Q4B50_07875, partial [Bacillota bacterium]|nr:hypothetical protein [Bacillota bacterium]